MLSVRSSCLLSSISLAGTAISIELLSSGRNEEMEARKYIYLSGSNCTIRKITGSRKSNIMGFRHRLVTDKKKAVLHDFLYGGQTLIIVAFISALNGQKA